MAHLIYGTVLCTMIFAQATIVPRVNPLSVSPDFVLLMLFLLAAFRGTRMGLAWLFIAGIITDIVAMDTLGTNGLAMLPAVLLAGPARERIFHANVLVPLVVVIVVTLAHGVILSLLRGVMPGVTTLLEALLHAILVPIFYVIFRRIS